MQEYFIRFHIMPKRIDALRTNGAFVAAWDTTLKSPHVIEALDAAYYLICTSSPVLFSKCTGLEEQALIRAYKEGMSTMLSIIQSLGTIEKPLLKKDLSEWEHKRELAEQ